MAGRKSNETTVKEPNSKVVKPQTVRTGKEPGVKYRVDFDSWEAYNKYQGRKG